MTISIGTRSSSLALWQANAVLNKLATQQQQCEIITIESTGDLNLTTPIYDLGISGVFTKELDAAILQNKVTIAVHSLKDVPTQLAEGLILAAVLKRGSYSDVLILKENIDLKKTKTLNIATSSIRRKAQWLMHYPTHNTLPIRGNVHTRLQKFNANHEMHGIIFAKAGLERVNMLPHNAIELNWMLPAPAQGVIGIVCKSSDTEIINILKTINHKNTYIAATIERSFMRNLIAGCSVPVSAHATINNNDIQFKGAIHAINGGKHNFIEMQFNIAEWETAGSIAANTILKQQGARELLNEIRNNYLCE